MGYDKRCLMGEIGFWVDFVGGLGDLERLVFRVGVWTNQLIVIPGNTRLLLVFATPLHPQNHGFSPFFRGKTYVL